MRDSLSLLAVTLCIGAALLATPASADPPKGWPSPPDARKAEARTGLTGIWEVRGQVAPGQPVRLAARITHDKGGVRLSFSGNCGTEAEREGATSGGHAWLEWHRSGTFVMSGPDAGGGLVAKGNDYELALRWRRWNRLQGTFSWAWDDPYQHTWYRTTYRKNVPEALMRPLKLTFRRLDPEVVEVDPPVVNRALGKPGRPTRQFIELRGSELPLVYLVSKDHAYLARFDDPGIRLAPGGRHSSDRWRRVLRLELELAPGVKAGPQGVTLLAKHIPRLFTVTDVRGGLEVVDPVHFALRDTVRASERIVIQARVRFAAAASKTFRVRVRNLDAEREDDPGVTVTLTADAKVTGLYRSPPIRVGLRSDRKGEEPFLEATGSDELEVRFRPDKLPSPWAFLSSSRPRVRVVDAAVPWALSFVEPAGKRILTEASEEETFRLRAKLSSSPTRAVDRLTVKVWTDHARAVEVELVETGPTSRTFLGGTLKDGVPFSTRVGDRWHARRGGRSATLHIVKPRGIRVSLLDVPARSRLRVPLRIRARLERAAKAQVVVRFQVAGGGPVIEVPGGPLAGGSPATLSVLPPALGDFDVSLRARAGSDEATSEARRVTIILPAVGLSMDEPFGPVAVTLGQSLPVRASVDMKQVKGQHTYHAVLRTRGEGKPTVRGEAVLRYDKRRRQLVGAIAPTGDLVTAAGHYDLLVEGRPTGDDGELLRSATQVASWYRIRPTAYLIQRRGELAERIAWMALTQTAAEDAGYEVHLRLRVAPELRPGHALVLAQRDAGARAGYELDLSRPKGRLKWSAVEAGRWTARQLAGGEVPLVADRSTGRPSYRNVVELTRPQGTLYLGLRWGIRDEPAGRLLEVGSTAVTFLGAGPASKVAHAMRVQLERMLTRLQEGKLLPADFDERAFRAEAARLAAGYGTMLAAEMKRLGYGLDDGGSDSNNARGANGQVCQAWQSLVLDWYDDDVRAYGTYRYLKLLAVDTPEKTLGLGEHHLAWLVLKRPRDEAVDSMENLAAGVSLDPWYGPRRYWTLRELRKAYGYVTAGEVPANAR